MGKNYSQSLKPSHYSKVDWPKGLLYKLKPTVYELSIVVYGWF